MNAFILYLWLQRMPMCAPLFLRKEACVCVHIYMFVCPCTVCVLHSPTTYSWATRSLMLQLFPATHVYLPVSSVVTSMISREPLGIFWNLEERRDGTDEGGGLELQNSEGARKKGSTTLKFLKLTFSNLQPSCVTKIVFHCWTEVIGAIYFPELACVRGCNILIAQKG